MAVGQILDTLIVEIKADISDFTRGLEQAARDVEIFAREVRSELDIDNMLAGIDAGDALNAALTVPLIAASVQAARTSEIIRRELRGVARDAAVMGRAGALGLPGPVIDGEATNVPDRRREGDDLLDAARRDPRGESPLDDEADARGRRQERNLRGGIRGAFSELATQTGNAARSLGRAVSRALGPALRIVADLGIGLLALSGGLPLLQGLFMAIGQAVGAAAAAVATFVGGPIGLLVIAIGALVALFAAANWDRFQEFFAWLGERVEQVLGARFQRVVAAAQRAWEQFAAIFLAIWEHIRPAMREHGDEFIAILRALSEVILGVLDGIGAAFEAFFGILEHVFGTIAALIRGDWSEAWHHFGQIFATIWNGLLDICGSVLMGLVRAVDQFFPGFEQGWRDFWARVADVCRNVFGGVVDWLGEKTREIGGFFAQLYDDVVGHSYVPDMMDRIAEECARLQGEMVDPIAEACDEAGSAFEGMQERAVEALDAIQGAISGAIEGLIRGEGFDFGDFVRGIVGTLGNQAVGRSMDLVNGVLGGIFDGFKRDMGLPSGGTPPYVPDQRQGSIINFNFPQGTDARGFQQSQGQIAAMVMRTVSMGRRYG